MGSRMPTGMVSQRATSYIPVRENVAGAEGTPSVLIDVARAALFLHAGLADRNAARLRPLVAADERVAHAAHDGRIDGERTLAQLAPKLSAGQLVEVGKMLFVLSVDTRAVSQFVVQLAGRDD